MVRHVCASSVVVLEFGLALKNDFGSRPGRTLVGSLLISLLQKGIQLLLFYTDRITDSLNHWLTDSQVMSQFRVCMLVASLTEVNSSVLAST